MDVSDAFDSGMHLALRLMQYSTHSGAKSTRWCKGPVLIDVEHTDPERDGRPFYMKMDKQQLVHQITISNRGGHATTKGLPVTVLSTVDLGL